MTHWVLYFLNSLKVQTEKFYLQKTKYNENYIYREYLQVINYNINQIRKDNLNLLVVYY